ncbi:unnamed protein product [Heligmosomoides polygyrus]|uniref:Cation_ATPase_N domain-containing protein n=1 Tax=Heligmosomoides polygyrus TaxID=6339 RepID=A0A183G2U3_HELPZ|nr:unnamed protein product [Heligmosomoides polygyrus]
MGEYGASLEELRALMEYRGAEAKEKIDADYGGITGLCERLKTDPNNGIPNTTTELERRRAVFGANEIPPHPPKCFLQLVWEALQVSLLPYQTDLK